MSEAEVKAFVGERCEEILLEVAEILGVKSPEEVLEAVQLAGSSSLVPKDAKVPWKSGRRTLASEGHGWQSVIGDVDEGGHPIWRGYFGAVLDADDPGVSTTLLRTQCPRCFAVDGHVPGCMVAANLARRIKPAWAPWAMWTMPKRLPVGYSLIVVNEACSPRRVTEFADWDHAEGAENDGIAVVCMGFDGLTLEPWGLE